MNPTLSTAKAETAAGREAAKADHIEQSLSIGPKAEPLTMASVREQIAFIRKRLASGERVHSVWLRGELYAKVLKEVAAGTVVDVKGICREALMAQALEVNRDELPFR